MLVDEYLTPILHQTMESRNGHPNADVIARAEAIWDRVVELEAEFWPEIGEEDTMRIHGTKNGDL